MCEGVFVLREQAVHARQVADRVVAQVGDVVVISNRSTSEHRPGWVDGLLDLNWIEHLNGGRLCSGRCGAGRGDESHYIGQVCGAGLIGQRYIVRNIGIGADCTLAERHCDASGARRTAVH